VTAGLAWAFGRGPRLLAPRQIDWTMRALDTARTSVGKLEDGRVELVIEHARLEGVTPAMLHWWFQTASEDMEWKGSIIPRYHVWHPVDHIQLEVVRRAADGTVGPGSRFHIVEAFGGDLANLVDRVVDVPRLDAGGITLEVRLLGRAIMRLAHTFTATEGGTGYHSRMLLGAESGLVMKPLSHAIRDRVLSDDKARAWLLHNVEEVGNLPHFLPSLYEARGR